jgi:hypothetical protein
MPRKDQPKPQPMGFDALKNNDKVNDDDNLNDEYDEPKINDENNENDKVNDEDNVIVNENVNINVDTIINGTKRNKTTLVGFHLEDDIKKALDKITQKSGKSGRQGIRSKIANAALRKFLEESGYL